MIPITPTTLDEILGITQSKYNLELKTDVTHLEFEKIFDSVLLKVATGTPLKVVLEEDIRGFSYVDFMKWVRGNEKRLQLFYDAQELSTEIMASDCIEIADGLKCDEDIQRSKLRIDTRMKFIERWNRKRFGDVKQLEVKSINISGILQERDMALQNYIDVRHDEVSE